MGDREALVDFYLLTTGKFWYQKWNWNSNLGYKKWYGVDIDNAGHVASIQLRENFLQGSLTEFHSIKKWKNLVTLTLFSNLLKGPLPSEIGGLESLRELNISWNKFSGPLPDSFYDLKELRVIKIDHNEFDGEISPKIGQLVHLQYINLSFNRFSGQLPFVGDQMPGLSFVDFSNNLFEGPVPGGATEYREFSAECARLRDGKV